MQTSSSLAISRIGDYDSFLKLHSAWNRLTDGGPVFLRHEWFDAAWQWCREDSRLSVFCVFGGERLVGILPLVARAKRVGGLTVRSLAFLCVPDTQTCDAIMERSLAREVAERLADALVGSPGRWDVLTLAPLPTRSLTEVFLLPALRSHGVPVEIAGAGRNLYVPLTGHWDQYYAGRSRSLKKANNLAANRLRRSGVIDVVWLEPGAGVGAEYSALLEAMIDISGRSWKRDTGNSLDNPAPQGFIRRLTALAAREGWLSLWLLSLDKKPVAMEYQLVFDGDVHALRADIVAASDEISPGSYLSRELLERLFSRGLRRYYMGPGENPYKLRWTEEGEPLFRITGYSPSFRGRLASLWELQLKPGLRALRDKTASMRPRGTGSP